MVSKQVALVLSVDAGPFAGKKLVVPSGETRTVGRTGLADLATEDGFMSGVHFSIHCNVDFAEIRDMGSTNKTYLNGVVVVKSKLNPKDRIRAGKTLFSISWETADEAPPESDMIRPVFTAAAELPGIKKESRPREEVADRSLFEEVEIVEASEKSHLGAKPDQTFPPSFASDPVPFELPKQRRNISPFDSVDQSLISENDGVKLPWVESVREKSSVRKFDSPFEDSVDHSALVKETIPENESQSDSNFDAVPNSSVPNSTAPSSTVPSYTGPSYTGPNTPLPNVFLRLQQRPSSRTEFDFCQIVSRLRVQNSCRIVAHFLKIGEHVPQDLECESVIPQAGQGSEYFPVLIERENWKLPQMLPISNRLVMADGIMLVIVNKKLDASHVLQNLTCRGAPGFSAQDGLLAWFWPSQLFAMAEKLSDAALFKLFGNEIEGIVAAVPQMENELYAVATQEVAEVLKEFGFAET